MSASGKRCHYEVLGVSRDASPDEIRSSYKRLALQLHPDKLVQSGLSQAEATSKFQELSLAYEVLSDTKERAWYDSHRSQILFSDPDSAGNSDFPNLFSFFSPSVYSGYGDSGKGFYKVYSDVFARVYASEASFVRTFGLGFEKLREAPVMGNLESPYEQVTAFYNYWLGFATVMDFCWVDKYDAGMGVNRKSRRVMEDENTKLRKKARKEYNETVRGLADFIKKRDKRVIDMMVRKGKEAEKRKEEERERKRRLEREKMERAREYEEPEWARVEAEELVEAVEEEEENGKKELYCVVCSKKFKSEKQWKNHEQSKKHKDKVAELRHAFKDEDEDENIRGMDDFNEHKDAGVDHDVDELGERLGEGLEVREEETSQRDAESEDEFVDAEIGDGANEKDGNSEKNDETSVLEAILEGRKGKKSRRARHVMVDIAEEIHVEDKDLEGEDINENRKGRRRRSRKERGKNGGKAEDVKHKDAGVDHDVDELGEGLGEGLEVQEEETSQRDAESEDEFVDAENGDGANEKDGNSEKDDETSVLEAMFQGQKGKKSRRARHVMGDIAEEVHVEDKDLEGEDINENRKGRRRRSRKERGKNGGKAEDVKGDNVECKSRDEETVAYDNEQVDGPSSPSFAEGDDGIKASGDLQKNRKSSKTSIPRKEAVKKEANNKSKSSSKGKKGKAASKGSDNVCLTCEEEFDSRTQLHKHLGDSGHATLKHR